MAEELTPQQKQAVENRAGRLLVSAAAGSGKTKVLVDRLMRYLTDPVDPANIDDFLMITYTNAAAAELRGKIAAKLTERVALEPNNTHLRQQLQRLYLTKISTVHAFCGDILREYAFTLNLPGDFRVADENECTQLRVQLMEKVLDEAYEKSLDDPDFRAFVDTQGLGRDDRQVPQIVLQVYDSARCHLEPTAWLEKCCALVHTQVLTDAAQTRFGEYLLAQLRERVRVHLELLENCVREAQREGWNKPAALLSDTCAQLARLCEAQTWEQVRAYADIDFGRLTFPKNADPARSDTIKAVREACKNDLKKQMKPFAEGSEQILKDLASSEQAVRGLVTLAQTFGKAYDAEKQRRRILDFGDLEHKALDLLLGKKRTAPTSAAAQIGARFREVMVDEYQDSNAVQDAIYAALTAQRKNIFMVGDVKQSIYQFRLADPNIFLDKYDRFVPAQQAQADEDRKILLSDNFRSSAGVLEACNDVFAQCMSRQVGDVQYTQEEALREGIAHIPLPEAEAELHCIEVQQQTYPEEAAFVAAHIRDLLRTGSVRDGDKLRPVRPDDITILLRSPGTMGAYYRRALERYGIRCTSGGGIDLLKTEEVGALYAILQAVYNPRMDIPLIAALSGPAFGFTADDLAAIRGKQISGTFYDALLHDDSPKSRAFVQTLERLRGVMRHYSLTELLERILVETALEEVYGAMDDAITRLTNLRTFYQLAVDMESSSGADVGAFLEHLSAMEEKGLIYAGDQASAGCVSIMSIHKSKGLEFPVVYLCGLSKDFNKENQRAAVLCHKEMGLGLFAADTRNRFRYPTIAKRAIAAKIGRENISEELRVLYVAMTRARDRLIMTYASHHLQTKLTQMVQRIDMGSSALLCQEAGCLGDWVLLTALQKTEAGALHALAGRPAQTHSGTHAWKISVDTAEQETVALGQTEAASAKTAPEDVDKIRQGLSFRYAHTAATCAPSKLTATGLKGRYQDEEAAQQTVRVRAQSKWRQANFARSPMQGKDYGNALHALMQYIDYACCADVSGVTAEIDRLRAQNFLSEEQAKAVNAALVAAFFATPLGEKLRQGEVVREFKFSILCDGAEYREALAGERILLQGVVDCALIEDDGITVIDFKTDAVDAQTLAQRVALYAPQVNAYARAMERIFEKRVKEKLLYFFHIGKFEKV